MGRVILTKFRHKIKSRASLFYLVAIILSSIMSVSVQAGQTGDSRAITFHGTLKKKPCQINNDGDIYIDFGNVGGKKVDGQRYIQAIPYTLVCEDVDPSWVLKMSIKGTVSNFSDTALNTNANGLGIQLLQNGIPLKINDAFVINYLSPPSLQAVPVKDPNVELQEQPFSTIATLLAEYQ